MRVLVIFNKALMFIAGGALCVMVVNVGAGVVSRSLFGVPIYGTTDFVAFYYMVLAISLPLAAVQLEKEHVFIEVFTVRLRAVARNRLDLFAVVVMVVYSGVLAWALLAAAVDSFQLGEYVYLYAFDLIIWPSRWLFFFGVLGNMLAGVALLIRRDYVKTEVEDSVSYIDS